MLSSKCNTLNNSQRGNYFLKNGIINFKIMNLKYYTFQHFCNYVQRCSSRWQYKKNIFLRKIVWICIYKAPSNFLRSVYWDKLVAIKRTFSFKTFEDIRHLDPKKQRWKNPSLVSDKVSLFYFSRGLLQILCCIPLFKEENG